MTSPRTQQGHRNDKGGPVNAVRQQKDGEVHSPPSLEDAGSEGQLVVSAGKPSAFYQLGHDLPNGLRINFTFGHIDRMPRCEATGLIVPFCSCDFHSQGFAQPCTDIRGETE